MSSCATSNEDQWQREIDVREKSKVATSNFVVSQVASPASPEFFADPVSGLHLPSARRQVARRVQERPHRACFRPLAEEMNEKERLRLPPQISATAVLF